MSTEPEYYEFPNPAYDPVFKFLMAEDRVAKLFISTLIGLEIIELHPIPTEYQQPDGDDDEGIKQVRLDFIAVFKQPDGSKYIALIEMQKNQTPQSLERFRNYLGVLYKGEKIPKEYKIAHIFAIFILGYGLPGVEAAITRTQTVLIDVETDEVISYNSEFIDGLHHTVITVQLSKIIGTKSEIAELFKVFDSRVNKQMVKLATQDSYVGKYKPVVDRLMEAGQDERLLLGLSKEMESEYLISQYKKLYEEEQEQKKEAERQKAQLQNKFVITLHKLGKSNKVIAEELGISIAEVEQILNAL